MLCVAALCRWLQFDIDLDEEEVDKMTTLKEAAAMVAAQVNW